jgi:hypothetical protein
VFLDYCFSSSLIDSTADKVLFKLVIQGEV